MVEKLLNFLFFFSVFTVDGKILLEDQFIGEVKYEGIEFLW